MGDPISENGGRHADRAFRFGAQSEPPLRQLLLRCPPSCIPAVVHMLLLNGAYRFGGRKTCFHRARRATQDQLLQLLDTLSRRIVRVLERRGLLIADAADPHLEFENGSSLEQIQAASIAYRIAIGLHAGRKALTLYSLPPLEKAPSIPLLATMYGFSLHAGTVCEAHQRSKLERLCRYITSPPAR